MNGWGHEGRARGPLGLARWVVGYVIGFCGAVSAGLAVSAASAMRGARADGVYLRYTVEVWLPGALGGCVAPSWIQMAIRMGAYMGNGVRAVPGAHHYSPVPRCVPAEAYRELCLSRVCPGSARCL